MLESLKLPFAFDPDLLKADLRAALAFEWRSHFNREYYSGDWSGIALRMTEGARHPLYSDPTVDKFVETPVLDLCPYLRSVMETFQCTFRAVRLLRLGAGAFIKEHRDYGLGFKEGILRVHVPIETNPDVHFILAGRRIELAEGEAWYLNLDLPHSVENRGATDRIHLVLDCCANDWWRGLLGID